MLLEETEAQLLAQRKEQVTAELKNFNEYDDIVSVFDRIKRKEVPDPALFLEWNVWRSLVMLNYAVRTEGNFVMDLDGMPVNTAPGKVPDIEVDYGDFGMIVEVTTSTGQKQYEMEGEPVARHYGKAQETKKNMYCLFIAPAISEGTLAHYFNLNKMNTKHYGVRHGSFRSQLLSSLIS
ncbi:MAG: AlwI family type II restriction endonuclease [Flavobacteriales bacterium]